MLFKFNRIETSTLHDALDILNASNIFKPLYKMFENVQGGANVYRGVGLPSNSVILDLETTGLDPRNAAITEASVFDLSTGKHTLDVTVQPHIEKQAVSRKYLLENSSEWFKSRAESLYSNVGRSKSAAHPRELVRGLSLATAGRTVWIQNAPFESKFIGSLLEHHGEPGEIEALRSTFETRPLSPGYRNNLFFVTGQAVQQARQMAYESGDWMPVFKEYLRSAVKDTKSTKVRDVQDVTRAIFSESQRLGLMKNTRSFYGTNINILSLAYGMSPEAHRSALDTIREGTLLNKLWRTATGLYHSREDGLLGQFRLLFSDIYREDLTALKKISAVQDLLATKGLQRSIAEARLAFEFGEGEIRPITSKYRAWMAPMETYEGKAINQLINIREGVTPKNLDEAIDLLTSETLRGKGLTLQVERAVNEIRTMGVSKLRELVHNPLPVQEAADKQMAALMARVGNFNNWDAARILLAKNPIKIGGAVAVGLAMGMATLDMLGGRIESPALNDESYINWDGLERHGIAAEMRRYETDFGSPWKGLLSFTEKFRMPRSVGPELVLGPMATMANISRRDLAARVTNQHDLVSVLQAQKLLKQHPIAYSRDIHIMKRKGDIARLEPSIPLHSLMAGTPPGIDRAHMLDSGFPGYSGHRAYHAIQGIGYGRILPSSSFGSPWRGLSSYVIRRFKANRLAGKSFTETLPGVFVLSREAEDVMRWSKSVTKAFAKAKKENVRVNILEDITEHRFRGVTSGIGSYSRHMTQVLSSTEQLEAFSIMSGKTANQIHRVIADLRGAEEIARKRNLSRMGFVSARLVPRDNSARGYINLWSTIRHEATHTYLSRRTKTELNSQAAKRVENMTQAELAAIGQYRDVFIEEAIAQRVGNQTVHQHKNPIFRELFHEFEQELMPLVEADISPFIREVRSKMEASNRVASRLSRNRAARIQINSKQWEGMQKSGLGYKQFRSEIWGKSFGGLGKLVDHIDDIYSLMKQNNITVGGVPVTAFPRQQFTNLLSKQSVFNKELLEIRKLGQGGFGSATLVYSAKHKNLQVLKTLHEDLKAAAAGSRPRQAQPLIYTAKRRKGFEDLSLEDYEVDRLADLFETTPYVFKGSLRQPGINQYLDVVEKAKQEAIFTNEADLFFSNIYKKTATDNPRTIKDMLEAEISAQRLAYKENPDAVPRIYSETIEYFKAQGGNKVPGFLQEFVPDTKKQLSPQGLAEPALQLKEYVTQTFQKGGIFNWDVGGPNVLVAPGNQLKVIDFGEVTRVNPISVEKYALLNEFADNIVRRTFGQDSLSAMRRLENPTAPKLPIGTQPALAAVQNQPMGTEPLIKQQAKIIDNTFNLSMPMQVNEPPIHVNTINSKIKSTVRSQAQATLQNTAAKDLFKNHSKGHTKGGS